MQHGRHLSFYAGLAAEGPMQQCFPTIDLSGEIGCIVGDEGREQARATHGLGSGVLESEIT